MRAAEKLLVEPAALATTTSYVAPLSLRGTLLAVKLGVFAPEIFPPLERLPPFLRHWYVKARKGSPEAETL